MNILTIADNILKETSLTKLDSFSISDTLIKDIEINKLESLVIAESLIKSLLLSQADSVIIADNLIRTLELIKTDLIGIVDDIYTELTGAGESWEKELSDLIQIAESASRQTVFYRDISDYITLTDSQQKAIAIIASDLITVRRMIAIITQLSTGGTIDWKKELSDSLSISDEFAKEANYKREISDLMTLLDDLNKGLGIENGTAWQRNITDLIHIIDSIDKIHKLVGLHWPR